MRTSSLLQLGMLFALTANGCRDHGQVGTPSGIRSDPEPEDAAIAMVVDSNAGRFTSNRPANFNASYHDPPVGPTYELVVGGTDATEKKVWDASLWPTAEQVQAESAEIQVVLGRGQMGGGTITLHPIGGTPADYVNATSGTVSVTFGHGRVQGTATAVPDELSATFQSSPLVLSCLVPPAMLADAGGLKDGGTLGILDPGGSVWVGVDDTDLVTPFCAGLRHLITP